MLSSSLLAIDASVFLAGIVVPGITAIMLGRVGEMAGNDPAARQRGWTQATVAWAIGQAVGAYGMAWLYGLLGGYPALLVTALAALIAAGAMELVMDLRRRPALAQR